MRPDRYQLYETAVQQPEAMVGFIEALFGRSAARNPCVLREDFCGSANLSTAWVRSGSDRQAVAVDRDAQVLRYAERRHRQALGGAAGRLSLVRADVFDCRAKADVIVSLNFSHFIYKTRAGLTRYFRHAARCLRRGGLLICDVYGGPGATRPGVDRRRFGDFTYLWEQASCDPITARVVNHIHFVFRDGSRMRRAFTYDWRLWTIPEMREILSEAGFADLELWFEDEGGFCRNLDVSGCDAWVAYWAARRVRG